MGGGFSKAAGVIVQDGSQLTVATRDPSMMMSTRLTFVRGDRFHRVLSLAYSPDGLRPGRVPGTKAAPSRKTSYRRTFSPFSRAVQALATPRWGHLYASRAFFQK